MNSVAKRRPLWEANTHRHTGMSCRDVAKLGGDEDVVVPNRLLTLLRCIHCRGCSDPNPRFAFH